MDMIIDSCFESPCVTYGDSVAIWDGGENVYLPMVAFNVGNQNYVKRNATIRLFDDGTWQVELNGVVILKGVKK